MHENVFMIIVLLIIKCFINAKYKCNINIKYKVFLNTKLRNKTLVIVNVLPTVNKAKLVKWSHRQTGGY